MQWGWERRLHLALLGLQERPGLGERARQELDGDWLCHYFHVSMMNHVLRDLLESLVQG